MPSFELLDAISYPSRLTNEDLFGATKNAAWVLDGATGLGAARVVPGPSDAHWLVAQIHTALQDELEKGGETHDVMQRTIRHAIASFQKVALRKHIPDGEMPCTCLAMARFLKSGELELSNIGDCRIVRRTENGNISLFGSAPDLELLERTVELEMLRLQTENVSHDLIMEHVIPMIFENRSRLNTTGGYWILDLTERSLPHFQRQTCPWSVGDELLLISDGFDRLVQLFSVHTYASLFEAARHEGLDGLYRQLRELETGDSDCRTYPRFKVSDDTTAVRLGLRV